MNIQPDNQSDSTYMKFLFYCMLRLSTGLGSVLRRNKSTDVTEETIGGSKFMCSVHAR